MNFFNSYVNVIRVNNRYLLEDTRLIRDGVCIGKKIYRLFQMQPVWFVGLKVEITSMDLLSPVIE